MKLTCEKLKKWACEVAFRGFFTFEYLILTDLTAVLCDTCGQNKCLLSSNIWHKTLVKHSFRTKLISSPLRCTIQLSIPGKEVEFNRAKETWLQTNVSYSRHNGHWIRYINTWSLNDTGIMTLGDKCNGIMGSIDWCVSCLHFAIIHVGKLVHRNGQKTRHIFPEGSVFQNGKVVSGEPGRKHPQLLNRSYPTALSLWKRRTPQKTPPSCMKKDSWSKMCLL